MKKTIIGMMTLALLFTATTASAHTDQGREKEDRGNKPKTVVIDASTTAQILKVKQQIAELNKQLAELKRTSHVGGKTMNSGNNDQDQDAQKLCSSFTKAHRHWSWKRHGRWGWGGWAFDQNVPERCKHLPGYGTSTTSVLDTTAPIISGIALSNIGSTTANVNWTTSEAATSKIFVSTTSPVATNGTPAWTDTGTSTSHGVQLTGLIPGTSYYFIITNTDAANNTGTSAQGSFVTIPLGDAVAPVISAIAVGSITSNSASISWNTSELATSKLFLSTSSPVSTSSAAWTDAVLAVSHIAPATALLPNTTYFFVIKATDGSLNETLSAQGTFTTSIAPDVTAPVISLLSAVPTGSSTANVTWTTNESATSKVYYSTTSPVNVATVPFVFDATLVTSHGVSLSGLSSSTVYFTIVETRDASNNVSTSSQTSFTTNP